MVSASLRNLQWSLERSLDVSGGLWEKPTRCIGRSADMAHAISGAIYRMPWDVQRDQECNQQCDQQRYLPYALGSAARSRMQSAMRSAARSNERLGNCSAINDAISNAISSAIYRMSIPACFYGVGI